MIIVVESDASESEFQALSTSFEGMGFRVKAHREGEERAIALLGGDHPISVEKLKSLPGVAMVKRFQHPFKLAGRELKKERSIITIGDVSFGDGEAVMIAGPCSIESEEQIDTIASFVASQGAHVLRGGAFKPRTSPYVFQGLGEEGLQYMQAAGEKYGLLTVSEVMEGQSIDLVSSYVDILQVGSRNMQNFSLLKQLSKVDKPILLKRGMAATYRDLLMAAEYLLSGGNDQVILCERGIRTFETHARHTLDIAAVPILHELSHLPVIVDPSHGTGQRSLVEPLSKASLAAGADGLMIEVHSNPDDALCDGQQSLSFSEFASLMNETLAPSL